MHIYCTYFPPEKLLIGMTINRFPKRNMLKIAINS